MGIKIADLPLISSLIFSGIESVIRIAADDAKAKGKDEITLEELEALKIKPRQDVIDKLKAIAEEPE